MYKTLRNTRHPCTSTKLVLLHILRIPHRQHPTIDQDWDLGEEVSPEIADDGFPCGEVAGGFGCRRWIQGLDTSVIRNDSDPTAGIISAKECQVAINPHLRIMRGSDRNDTYTKLLREAHGIDVVLGIIVHPEEEREVESGIAVEG